jgi:hypothetical protein
VLVGHEGRWFGAGEFWLRRHLFLLRRGDYEEVKSSQSSQVKSSQAMQLKRRFFS